MARLTRGRAAAAAAAVLVTALAIAALLAGVGERRSSSEPRLVLLYAPCSVNRMRLSPYDPSVAYTPNIGAFGAESLVFTRHHTEEGQSTIAYASLLTGVQAMRHGAYVNPTKLSDSVELIFEAYRDHGYETFFWSDHPMASPQLNFAQGVEPANTFWREDRFHGPYPLRAADPRFQEILAKLAADPGYKAFVVTSFTVSHWLYSDKYLEDFCRAHAAQCRGLSAAEIEDAKAILTKHKIGLVYAFDATIAKIGLAPERLDAMIRYAELLYESNIFQLDRFFGEVIDEIDRRGATDESLVVFTADHGEIPYRPTVPLKWTHGYFLTADDIPVPMILRGRAVPPGRYDGVTRSIDVFPTLAALSGFALAKDAVMGADLADAVRGESPPPPLVAYFHSSLILRGHVWFPEVNRRFPKHDPSVIWVAAREGDRVYKLTSQNGATFAPHVYDWGTDPTEQQDLYDPDDAHHAEMVRRLAQYKSRLVEGYGYWQAKGEGRLPTEREEEMLRSLGYVE